MTDRRQQIEADLMGLDKALQQAKELRDNCTTESVRMVWCKIIRIILDNVKELHKELR